jgi:hypothetical protein
LTFERPDAWWLLALAAPIVALHLHHRRRRVVEVSSVELWRGLVTGSAGRGRFRLLRDALAMAFVLAALGAFTASAAGPVTGSQASGPRRVVIVIDASPTMLASIDGHEQPFVAALRRAWEAESRLASQDEMCVWLATERPRVIVEPRHPRAGSYGSAFNSIGYNAGPWPAGPSPSTLVTTTRLAIRSVRGSSALPTTVLVLTDPVGADSLKDIDSSGVDVRLGVISGPREPQNAGIVSCDVDPSDSTRLLVRVVTTDGSPTPRTLALWGRDNTELARTTLTFDASGGATATLPLGEVEHSGGLLEVRLEPWDDFGWDDRVLLMLPATKPLAVAVVSDKPSPFLVEALRAMPDVADPAKTTLVAPNAPASSLDGVDVVIAEGVAAPAGKPSLTFVGAGPRVAEKPLLWGVGTHALLAGVDLSPLRIERAVVLDVAAGETPIVASAAGTVGVVGETDGMRRVTFGFRPDATTLPLEAAFPLLVRNALRWLAKPPAAPRYVVAGEPWPDGDGALVPYSAPWGSSVVTTPAGASTVVRWIPPKGFHLSPATPTKTPSAADVVASLPDRHGDSDTRQRHAPWLAAVGAALLAIGAALLRTSRPAVRPSVPAPAVEFAASR